MTEPAVLEAVITCPECGAQLTGYWAAGHCDGEPPEPAVQQCPGCELRFTAGYPGWSFYDEAG